MPSAGPLIPALVAAALVTPAATACAPVQRGPGDPPTLGQGMTTVQVTASYRERILMLPGSTLTVRVEDVSLADAAARVLAEQTVSASEGGPPYTVTLGFPSSQVDPRHTYAARAEIRDADGRLRFTTDTRHTVLTYGAPATANIVMVGVR